MISWGSWLRGIAVAALMAGLAWTGAEAASTKVTIVGAGKGAGAFRQAGAIAEVVNKESKTVNMTNQETAGFVANTRMLANGRVEFALTNGVFVDAIQTKQHPFDKERKAATNLRGIGPVAGAWLQIAILADSGIMKVEDLKGKRVSLGPKGSNTVYMLEVVFKAVGIYDSLRKDYLKWEDAATYMVDGKLDSFGMPNPIPGPALLQAAQSRPIRMLDIPEKALDEFIKISKAYFKTDAGMSVYRGMEGKKIRTIAYDVYILAHDKVPADVVYEVAKHFYDPKNRDFILNVYRPLKDGLDAAQDDKFIQQMKSFGLKLHPGAERYWKERKYNVN
ncbi:MAG: TAXI family TRAP transporter solute-binding subunit, partial [Candidatus Tectomicrobia bacterium]|nr:TAXI family TRAP transporter solute-binding subunit [Candidatus Tectomicrobia bacterium]